MTKWEFKTYLILHLAKLLNVKLIDLYDSYPYNPYSKQEVEEFWNAQLANVRNGKIYSYKTSG